MATENEEPDSLRALKDAAHLVDLHVRLRQVLEPLGFDSWAIGCLRDGNRPASMFLQHWPPDWIKEYIAAGYAAHDPAVARVMVSPEPFTWDDLRAGPLSEEAQRIMHSAESGFGWRSGLTIPIHGPRDERGIVSLASRAPAAAVRDRPLLVAMARAAYRRGRTLDLDGASGPGLSVREREALTLVAQGHDDAEIAAILGVSKATAHAHVERAKRRLGARTRAQAIAVAFSLRLLENK